MGLNKTVKVKAHNRKTISSRQKVINFAYKTIFDWHGDNYSGPQLEESQGYHDKIVVYGVNWSAKGTVSIAETKEYIRLMREAVIIGNSFNILNVTPMELSEARTSARKHYTER